MRAMQLKNKTTHNKECADVIMGGAVSSEGGMQ